MDAQVSAVARSAFPVKTSAPVIPGYSDATTSDMQMTLMAESEEELRNLVMRVKESAKKWFEAQHQKN